MYLKRSTLPQKSPSKITSKIPISKPQQVATCLNPVHCWGRSEQFINISLVVASHSQTNSGRGNRRLRRWQHVIKYCLPYLLLLVWLLLSCNISCIGKFSKSLLFSHSFDSILFYFSVHSSYLSPLFWQPYFSESQLTVKDVKRNDNRQWCNGKAEGME